MSHETDWAAFTASTSVGDVIEGVVTRTVPFGAFVEHRGVTGLAFEQDWPEGAEVRVRVLAIDGDRRRFSLAPA